MNGKLLTADDINSAPDIEIQPVEVPEWGGTVHLRVMPSGEGAEAVEEIQALVKQGKGKEGTYTLLAKCLVSPDGVPLFTPEEAKAKLPLRSHRVIARLEQAALKLNGFGPEAKNVSGEAAPVASPIDSLSVSAT